MLTGTAAAAGFSPNCSAPERRQFDFWVGDWTVRDAKGKLAGTNLVTREFGGCALQEHWKGVSADRGSSFNSYLPGARLWQQTWVDNQGLTLHLTGGLVDGSMVLRGTRILAHGGTALDRIIWTPLRGGRVRQHWQESTDNGKNYTEIFDGYYSRRSAGLSQQSH
ncbi:MAG TPA: hypothetical protein VFE17_11835 [Candidatus Baltobacteraceae bacterium]|nr:hypothetical protein [Candidatus Baltobacteraceae bacterium]